MGRLSRIIQVSPKAITCILVRGRQEGAVFAHTEEKRQCGQRETYLKILWVLKMEKEVMSQGI